MPLVTLHRFLAGPDGTFGTLTFRSRPLCVTCELPWFRNAPRVSCVPNGLYACAPHTGERYKEVWRLLNVPNRSSILIHAGNTINDTEGCILVGRAFTQDPPGIADAQAALALLRRTLPKEFDLRITGIEALNL